MGRNSSSSTSTSTQTTKLPGFQQEAVNSYFDELMRQFNETGLQRETYGGQLVAGLTPDQIAAQTTARDYATGTGQNYANRVLDTSSYLLDPQNLLDPSRIPGFDASQTSILRLLTQNLNENILPQQRTGSILAGGYGDSRSQIGDALAIGRTNQAAADALSRNQMNAYFGGLDAMLQALSLAPNTFGVGLAPADVLQRVGGQQQAQQQAEIDAEVRRFEQQQNEPLQALALLHDLVGSAGQYGGTTSGTNFQRNSSSSNPLQTIGAIAAAGLAPTLIGGGGLSSLIGGSLAGGAASAVPSFIPSFAPSASAVMPSIQQAAYAPGGIFDPNRLGLSLAPIARGT